MALTQIQNLSDMFCTTIPCVEKQVVVDGRDCPWCGGRDTRHYKGVRKAVTALCDIGLQVEAVNIEKARMYESDELHKIVFYFKREYNPEMFEALPFPKKYELDGRRLICTSKTFDADYKVLGFDSAVMWHEAMFEEQTLPLVSWAQEAEESGLTGIWLLAGYFD